MKNITILVILMTIVKYPAGIVVFTFLVSESLVIVRMSGDGPGIHLLPGVTTSRQRLHLRLSDRDTELGTEVAKLIDRTLGTYIGQLNGWLVRFSFD